MKIYNNMKIYKSIIFIYRYIYIKNIQTIKIYNNMKIYKSIIFIYKKYTNYKNIYIYIKNK
jgi:hypothetical protein